MVIDMVVYGVDVCEIMLSKIMRRFVASGNRFTKNQLTCELERNGVPSTNGATSNIDLRFVSDRVADRLLQRWKRCGYIFYCGVSWYALKRPD